MFHRKRTTFFCFSPPVMIITFLIEFSLMAYALWRYKFTTLTKLSAALLFFLSLFQLAEFQVCQGLFGAIEWSNVGFVAITLLPPLGMHAIYTIAKKRSLMVWAAYTSSALFATYFAFANQSITGHECLGNYVIFQVNANMTMLYGIYYWGWVVFGMVMAAMLAKDIRNKRQKQALYGFSAGYAVFLIPTTVANLVNNTTIRGIPSIMCGFAVLFALILGFYVLPRIAKLRT